MMFRKLTILMFFSSLIILFASCGGNPQNETKSEQPSDPNSAAEYIKELEKTAKEHWTMSMSTYGCLITLTKFIRTAPTINASAAQLY